MSGSQIGLSFKAKSMLIALGFKDPETINIINTSFLATMVNDFVLKPGGAKNTTGIFVKNGPDKNQSFYRYSENVIGILPRTFTSGKEGERDYQYMAVLALAHELGHSVSPQYRYDYSTIETAAHTSKMWEGVALYYEFMALRSLYPDKKEFTAWLWEDNKSTHSGDVNLYQPIFDIVNSEKTYQEKIEEIAELNTEFVRAPLGTSGIMLTYDEFIKWDFLKRRTDFAVDYKEASGKFLARTIF